PYTTLFRSEHEGIDDQLELIGIGGVEAFDQGWHGRLAEGAKGLGRTVPDARMLFAAIGLDVVAIGQLADVMDDRVRLRQLGWIDSLRQRSSVWLPVRRGRQAADECHKDQQ